MNTRTQSWFLSSVVAVLFAATGAAYAQQGDTARAPPASPAAVEAPSVEGPEVEKPASEKPFVIEAPAPGAQADADEDSKEGEAQSGRHRWRFPSDGQRPRWHHSDNDLVSIGGNSSLAKDQHADTVVSVFGSSTVEGNASDAVVSVLGDTRVTGTVGDDAVSVLGDTYVNGTVSGEVVSVLGNVELGPNAVVEGDVVAVGGKIKRDPGAVVRGAVRNVFGVTFGSFRWLRPWVEHCLLYLRPLAIAPGLGWAWALALGFLAVYAAMAVVFKETVDRAVRTFETQPGHTLVAGLLAMLLTPVLFALLCVTVIGVFFVPLAGLALFLATMFGKAVVLAWLGHKCTKLINHGERMQTAAAVLAGGAIVLLLYLVPVLGFIVYKVLGILGLGVAAYTLILVMRERRGESSPPPAFAAGGGGTGPYSGGSSGSPASESFTAGTTSRPDSAARSGDVLGAGEGFNAFDGPRASGASSAGHAGDANTSGASAFGAAGAAAATGASSAGGAGGGAAGGSGTAVPASTLPRADFTVRMAALLIDAVLVSIVLRILHSSGNGPLLALAVYGAAMWKLKGTTIGGIVFGLQVVRVDGRPIDWSTAVVRALSCFLSLFVLGLGFISIAFDEGKQGWHDKIAGTAVVRVPKGVSLL